MTRVGIFARYIIIAKDTKVERLLIAQKKNETKITSDSVGSYGDCLSLLVVLSCSLAESTADTKHYFFVDVLPVFINLVTIVKQSVRSLLETILLV